MHNILTVAGLTLLANVAAIDWVACPPEQIAYTSNTWDCAYLEFDLDRADTEKGKVTSFVRRGYVGSPGMFWVLLVFNCSTLTNIINTRREVCLGY